MIPLDNRTDRPSNEVYRLGSRMDRLGNGINYPGNRNDHLVDRVDHPGNETDHRGNKIDDHPGNGTGRPAEINHHSRIRVTITNKRKTVRNSGTNSDRLTDHVKGIDLPVEIASNYGTKITAKSTTRRKHEHPKGVYCTNMDTATEPTTGRCITHLPE